MHVFDTGRIRARLNPSPKPNQDSNWRNAKAKIMIILDNNVILDFYTKLSWPRSLLDPAMPSAVTSEDLINIMKDACWIALFFEGTKVIVFIGCKIIVFIGDKSHCFYWGQRSLFLSGTKVIVFIGDKSHCFYWGQKSLFLLGTKVIVFIGDKSHCFYRGQKSLFYWVPNKNLRRTVLNW